MTEQKPVKIPKFSPPEKTVKVRIAVAVDSDGTWNASGWSGDSYKEAMNLAIEGVETGEARYWVTAEIAVPKTKEVDGEVASVLLVNCPQEA